MAQNKLIKFIPDQEIIGVFNDSVIAKSESEVTVSAHPSVISQLLLRGVTVKEVSHDGSREELITWDNLWKESTMPKAAESIIYDNSTFTGVVLDYTNPKFKVSARLNNVDQTKKVIRKVTIAGQAEGTKVLVNGVETLLDGTGSFTYEHTGDYNKTLILECEIVNHYTVGTSLSVTQTTTVDDVKIGVDNTITTTVEKGNVNFDGSVIVPITRKENNLTVKHLTSKVQGTLLLKARVTDEDAKPIKGIVFDSLLGPESITDDNGEAIIRRVENCSTFGESFGKFMIIKSTIQGIVNIELLAEIEGVETEIVLANNKLLLEILAPTAVFTFTNKSIDVILGSDVNIELDYAIEHIEPGVVNRVAKLKKGTEYVSDFIVKGDNGTNLVSNGQVILPTLSAVNLETPIKELYSIQVKEAGVYTLELDSYLNNTELYSKGNELSFTVSLPAPSPVIKSEVSLTDTKIVVTKTVDSDCEVVVATKGTQNQVGNKSVKGNVTTVTGLKGNTQYDVYVQRTGDKRSTVLSVKTEITVTAPAPVTSSEVTATHDTLTITKQIADGDKLLVFLSGKTDVEQGTKAINGNVTVISGLQPETQYDLYVERTLPAYQGGGKVKSTKLTVATVAAPVEPPVEEQPDAVKEQVTE